MLRWHSIAQYATRVVALSALAAVFAFQAPYAGLSAIAHQSSDRFPLEAFLSPPAHAEEQQLDVEHRIRSCMAMRGFEYIPLDRRGSNALPPALRLPIAEFRRLFGYGISTRIGNERTFESPAQADPNEHIYASLPPHRRRAYDIAYGGGPELEIRDATGKVRFKIWPESCLGRALSSVFGSQERQLRAKALIDPLKKAMDRRIGADSRVSEAVRAWSACMEANRMSFASPKHARGSITADLKELAASDSALLSKRPEGARSATLRRLAELQRRERTLALADARCALASDLDGVVSRVRRLYESAFVLEHYDLLVQMRSRSPSTRGH